MKENPMEIKIFIYFHRTIINTRGCQTVRLRDFQELGAQIAASY